MTAFSLIVALAGAIHLTDLLFRLIDRIETPSERRPSHD